MSVFSKLFSPFAGEKSARRTVGIDIGSSSIKVVELEDRQGVVTLTTYGELQLGPYDGKTVGEVAVLDPKKEQHAMVDVLRESAVRAGSAVFAMPLSSSFVTVMSLPETEVKDLGPQIRVEARKYIPTQISEVTLDWAEIAQSSEKVDHGESHREVLLAAIQNTALQRYNALLEFVGLAGTPTEIECFSTLRALRGSDDVHSVIVDVGASVSKLYITHAGLLQRMHRVRAGGAVVTKRIGEVMQLSIEAAEVLKRSVGHETPHPDVIKAHRSCYERPFMEFQQVIREYEHAFGVSVSSVVLTGGESLFPETAVQLKQALGKEVTLATPFSKVAYPAFMEDMLRAIGPVFAVSVGAALRDFE